MKPIIVTMLAVDAALILAVAWSVVLAKWADDRPKPSWAGIIIPLVVAAGASQRIADSHAGQPGADLILFASALLFGMALMGAFVAWRTRRRP
jgi:hypothetical protein